MHLRQASRVLPGPGRPWPESAAQAHHQCFGQQAGALQDADYDQQDRREQDQPEAVAFRAPPAPSSERCASLMTRRRSRSV
jgi:hypothetical protein